MVDMTPSAYPTEFLALAVSREACSLLALGYIITFNRKPSTALFFRQKLLVWVGCAQTHDADT